MERSSSINRRRGVATIAATALMLVVGVACYGPTELRVQLSTDVPCAVPDASTGAPQQVRTTVKVGTTALDAAIVADTTGCTQRGDRDGDIGSLVLVPSGERNARVTVQVTMTKDGSDTELCTPRTDENGVRGLPSQCIVARRTFAFIEHSSHLLPITLYGDCGGKLCGDTESCVSGGACRPALEDPEECKEKRCADASAPDAHGGDSADGAVVAPCLALDGTDVLSGVEQVTDLLAGNATQLFWAANDPAGKALVKVLSKHGVPAKNIELDALAVTALAADDAFLWIGSKGSLKRVELSSGKVTSITPPGTVPGIVTSIATRSGGVLFTTEPVSAPVGTTHSPSISEVDAKGNLIVPPYANGIAGMLAATGNRLYSIEPGGIALQRHVLPWSVSAAPEAISTPPLKFVAAVEGTALFTAENAKGLVSTAGLYRLPDVSTTDGITRPAMIVQQGSLEKIVADAQANAVFYIRQVADDAAVFSVPLDAPEVSNATIGNLGVKKVTASFAKLRGLVLDASCVYFWATKDATASAGTLRAAHRVPKPSGPSTPPNQ